MGSAPLLVEDQDELAVRRERRTSGSRQQEDTGTAPRRCACGGEWFHLDGTGGGVPGLSQGAVTLAADGRVTGYFGHPVCVDCGTVVR